MVPMATVAAPESRDLKWVVLGFAGPGRQAVGLLGLVSRTFRQPPSASPK